jgi:hypothetical protein
VTRFERTIAPKHLTHDGPDLVSCFPLVAIPKLLSVERPGQPNIAGDRIAGALQFRLSIGLALALFGHSNHALFRAIERANAPLFYSVPRPLAQRHP